MMLDKLLVQPGKLRTRLIHLHDDDHPVAGQIIGNEPAQMAAAAEQLCRTGFDAVDVNLACPARKILSRQRGGYLLTQPEHRVLLLVQDGDVELDELDVEILHVVRGVDEDRVLYEVAVGLKRAEI